MRERKYVKFRVDMYEDTKFKIIDMKPERDVIHYIWNRLVMLAGKVNLEGELFLSKNIPYTVETLAIEFNRDSGQVKLALELFIELEMMEFADGNVYRVKNFAKHQNIKVKEKEIGKSENHDMKNNDIQINQDSIDKVENTKDDLKTDQDTDKAIRNGGQATEDDIKTTNTKVVLTDGSEADESDKNNLVEYNPKTFEIKNRRGGRKKKKDPTLNIETTEEIISEDGIRDDMTNVIEGTAPLENRDKVVSEWSFG
ncbi:phage replisome organizer N-terminal domain-containing protein [Clostridium manihotivorum]|uniref:Phage replisome organizer n=1 Tax=Clostridium manihotivorum TaxID=2320868 RepID=A0A3R5QZ78_9CLOT|nr:phage replisome organizer N-terminal domain-containing protein [Clostridium manihotivorum]QAA33027.1 phage replisome organizer [Clostridium manihotivorum]